MTRSSPPPVTRESSEAAQSDRPLLRIAGLSKGYREGGGYHPILENADASLRMGEFVALLGPSGSGKSTLLNLVSGIDTPDAGEVVVDGVSLTGMTERERTLFRRHQIGFVFQFFNLIPTLSVEENLLLPLELKGRLGAEERRKARSLLEQVGLGGRESTYPDRLSGGEQQRVAVARALVHDPVLVLADEPTGNLDAETGNKTLDLLVSMVSAAGKTLFAVTHSRDVAARADRVLRIQGGLLVEDPSSGDPVRAS
ncbi:MAG: ABC transporter ATP-binding protein [Deltaproteobacteria bacterium]|nr:ABC transporter ATP-binding protein [Deltaproteobacteria bacterium]